MPRIICYIYRVADNKIILSGNLCEKKNMETQTIIVIWMVFNHGLMKMRHHLIIQYSLLQLRFFNYFDWKLQFLQSPIYFGRHFLEFFKYESLTSDTPVNPFFRRLIQKHFLNLFSLTLFWVETALYLSCINPN